MRIAYAQQPLEKSIFLAGPTPRDPSIQSWRPQAIRILESLRFDGLVLVPEPANFLAKDSYDDQVHWEWEGLNMATVIAFWVPRELATMPGFTTNIEFGKYDNSGKIVLGYPAEAPKMRYFAKSAERYRIPVFHDLTEMLTVAVEKTKLPFGA